MKLSRKINAICEKSEDDGDDIVRNENFVVFFYNIACEKFHRERLKYFVTRVNHKDKLFFFCMHVRFSQYFFILYMKRK
jgi:hypothetical protein